MHLAFRLLWLLPKVNAKSLHCGTRSHQHTNTCLPDLKGAMELTIAIRRHRNTWDEHVAEVALPAHLLHIQREGLVANGWTGENMAVHCRLRVGRQLAQQPQRAQQGHSATQGVPCKELSCSASKLDTSTNSAC